MKFEFSAGGVVVKHEKTRKGTKTTRKDTKILVAQHSEHHGWVFPKGLIGDHVKGEKKEATAIREVEEETGVQAKILQELPPAEYWYQLKGQKIKKRVYYFLMEYISENRDKRDMEMENVDWLPLTEVENRLTYSSDKKVWKEARKLITTR